MAEPTNEVCRRLAEAGHYAIQRGVSKHMTIDLIVVPGGITVIARDRNDWTTEYVVTWYDLENAAINIMRPAIDDVIEQIERDQSVDAHCNSYGV